MKKIIITGFLIANFSILVSQSLMTLSKPIFKNQIANVKDLKKADLQKKVFDIFGMKVLDTAISQLKAKYDSLSMLEFIDSLNENDMVIPLANGGASNLEDIKKSFGNLSFGLLFRLNKYKLKKVFGSNWIDPHYIYMMFNTKTASSTDSGSLEKTLIFPELGKRDFVLGYYWEWQKNNWYISPTLEFSISRYNDSNNHRIMSPLNYVGGIKIGKVYQSSKNIKYAFQLFPYYSLIYIDKKYDISALNIGNSYKTVGMQCSIQIQNANMFCNMKYILNKDDSTVNPELKRFVYTIGTMITLF